MRLPMLATLCVLFVASARALDAQGMTYAGILGNSGEQGKTLVRFGATPAHGLGVVFDRYGTVWDRGGSGVLNRYRLDGRLAGSYPLPLGNRESESDRQTMTDAGILLLLDGKLYLLSPDAANGTKPESLGITAAKMSFAAANGHVALLQEGRLTVFDAKTGTLTPALSQIAGNEVGDLALMDDNAVLVEKGDNVRLFRQGLEVKIIDMWPKSLQTGHLQHVGRFWYGEAYHGTVHRFDEDFQPAPGVVLGGGSGSFIGHVEGDEELSLGNGVAALGDKTIAVSGRFGILSLAQWDDATERYQLSRRLGAIPRCMGLAINDAGDIWFNFGRWSWADLPTSPLRDSISGDTLLGQIALSKDGSFLAVDQRGGAMNILHGGFNWKSQLMEEKTLSSDMLHAAAIVQSEDGRRQLLLMNSTGIATAITLGAANEPSGSPSPVHVEFESPPRSVTSLATGNGGSLLAGVDGNVVVLTRTADGWRESARWSQWGAAPSEHFGEAITIAVDEGHLWVSDTQRARVLCFDLKTKKPLAASNPADQAGDDDHHLTSPTTVAVRHGRAVVFDSANQRLVKLSLNDPTQ